MDNRIARNREKHQLRTACWKSVTFGPYDTSQSSVIPVTDGAFRTLYSWAVDEWKRWLMIQGSNRSRFRQALALFLVLGALLAACGGGDGESHDNVGQAGAGLAATDATIANDPTATEDSAEDASAPEPVDQSTSAPESNTPTTTPEPTATPEPAAGEESQDEAAEPEDLAPEFGSIDNWYNGDPTTLAALRGTPVLLVFWADY